MQFADRLKTLIVDTTAALADRKISLKEIFIIVKDLILLLSSLTEAATNITNLNDNGGQK